MAILWTARWNAGARLFELRESCGAKPRRCIPIDETMFKDVSLFLREYRQELHGEIVVVRELKE